MRSSDNAGGQQEPAASAGMRGGSGDSGLEDAGDLGTGEDRRVAAERSSTAVELAQVQVEAFAHLAINNVAANAFILRIWLGERQDPGL